MRAPDPKDGPFTTIDYAIATLLIVYVIEFYWAAWVVFKAVFP